MLHFVPKIWVEKLTIICQAMQLKAGEIATLRRDQNFKAMRVVVTGLWLIQNYC